MNRVSFRRALSRANLDNATAGHNSPSTQQAASCRGRCAAAPCRRCRTHVHGDNRPLAFDKNAADSGDLGFDRGSLKSCLPLFSRGPKRLDRFTWRLLFISVDSGDPEFAARWSEKADHIMQWPARNDADGGVLPLREFSQRTQGRRRNAREIRPTRNRRECSVKVENRRQATAAPRLSDAVCEVGGSHERYHGAGCGAGASALRSAELKSRLAQSYTFFSRTCARSRSILRRRSPSGISRAARIACAVPAAS